jgi:hypothetical protein
MAADWPGRTTVEIRFQARQAATQFGAVVNDDIESGRNALCDSYHGFLPVQDFYWGDSGPCAEIAIGSGRDAAQRRIAREDKSGDLGRKWKKRATV